MTIKGDIEALEKVLEAGPTEGPFFADNDEVYRVEDTERERSLIHVMTAQFMGDPMHGGLTAVDAEWFAACFPDRIRRLLDALDERDGTVLRTMAAYRQEREAAEKAEVWLSKAIELLTAARDDVWACSAMEVKQRHKDAYQRQLEEIDAFLKEVSE